MIGLPPERLHVTLLMGKPAIVSAPSTALAIELAISFISVTIPLVIPKDACCPKPNTLTCISLFLADEPINEDTLVFPISITANISFDLFMLFITVIGVSF